MFNHMNTRRLAFAPLLMFLSRVCLLMPSQMNVPRVIGGGHPVYAGPCVCRHARQVRLHGHQGGARARMERDHRPRSALHGIVRACI
jgi:hypothetical protein